MVQPVFRTWKEFNHEEYRRFGAVQLSVEEIAQDLYFDPSAQDDDDESTALFLER